mgnify:CR=1 FL=1
MTLEKQLVSIIKQIHDEKRLGDKRAEQFYNSISSHEALINEHIDHTAVTLTAGIGLTGGGTIAANRTFNVDVGIADNKIVQIDGVAVANDYAKFTANGLLGRSYDEALSDLSGQALAAFDWNAQNLTGIGNLTMGQILQLTEATAVVIRPSVDSGQMTIYGSINPNEGAKLEFFGGDHVGTPGNIYLDYGDFTKAAPASSKLYIRYMNNGAITNALICDNSGNVFLPNVKSGATQAASGAVANELWKTSGHVHLEDNVVMIGV